MSTLSKVLFLIITALLLLSLVANGGLLFYILQQNALMRELRTEVLNLRQERDKLQQEVAQLRAQSLAPIELNKTLDIDLQKKNLRKKVNYSKIRLIKTVK